MAMTPFALSMLGAEALSRRTSERPRGMSEVDGTMVEAIQVVPDSRPSRASLGRRSTSYHNSFQTHCSPASDEPPSYSTSISRPLPTRRVTTGSDVLPKYSCSVAAEAKVLLHFEQIYPFHPICDIGWREAYLVLRGTLLTIHKPKDSGPGKLIRKYTLQHAEVGLAPDSSHTVLVPQTRMAKLIPSSSRQKAWQKDPELFKPVRQHLLRLRAETDQILLADASEDRIHSLVHAISAAIDISHSLDERSVPRQCTVPRRRRRARSDHQPGDLTDPALLAQQERILRDMYPAFAERTEQTRPELQRTTTGTTEEDSIPVTGREEDDLDLSMIREDPSASSPSLSSTARRPTASRTVTSTSINSSFSADMMYATSSTNFGTSGKWQPPHNRTHQQVQRYVRRCMPVLLAESSRASDVLIHHGRRVKINWRMELLEEWELKPPSYKSHGFEQDTSADRPGSISQVSTTSGSAAQDNAQASTSVLGNETEDQITPAEAGLRELDLAKVNTNVSVVKRSPTGSMEAERRAVGNKTRDTSFPNADVHGVLFCF